MSNCRTDLPGVMLQDVTIAAGASVSEIIATNGMALIGIRTDGGWTAAAIGYKTGYNQRIADMATVYDSGGNYEQTLVSTDAASNIIEIAIPTNDTIFRPFLQLTSRTAGSDTGVNQVAARVLTLVFKTYLS